MKVVCFVKQKEKDSKNFAILLHCLKISIGHAVKNRTFNVV